MSEATTNGHNEVPANNLPSWLSKISLEKAVQAQIGDFEKIISVIPQKGSSDGDNYSTQFLRLLVEVELIGECGSILIDVYRMQIIISRKYCLQTIAPRIFPSF